jgi:octaprenyl-diphosphate synthase
VGIVVELENKRGKKPTFDVLTAIVAEDMALVNQLILKRMESPVALIPQLAGHVISAGGKRLRPMLTLASAKLCGYHGERHITLATCIEFIHTATLLHDDVVDESKLRRGLETANSIWGNQASVLVGDFLFSRSFELMVEDGSVKVMGILASASARLAEGEVMQLLTANDTETGESAYLDVIKAKTAKLFAASCRLGAIVADRPSVEEEGLEAFGMNLGVAFQLIDDVLDYSAKQATLGKNVGDDFQEGKITLPVILAFRRGDDKERIFWRRTLGNLEQNDTDLERAITLLQKHHALDDTVDRARHYGAMARDSLGIFPTSETKDALISLIDFCIERPY